MITIAFWTCLGLAISNASVQSTPKDPPKLGWSNDTDLNLVLTGGNSTAQTSAVSDVVRHMWNDARFDFEVSVIRSYTSDDRFVLVEPGLEFPAGGKPENPSISLVKPDPTLDLAKSLVRAGYERNRKSLGRR